MGFPDGMLRKHVA